MIERVLLVLCSETVAAQGFGVLTISGWALYSVFGGRFLSFYEDNRTNPQRNRDIYGVSFPLWGFGIMSTIFLRKQSGKVRDESQNVTVSDGVE